MNLREIRALLDESLGSNDLSNETKNLYINYGQRLLDRMADLSVHRARMMYKLEAGSYVIPTGEEVRFVINIRGTYDGNVIVLEKKSLEELLLLYPDRTTTGTPAVWAANYPSASSSSLTSDSFDIPVNMLDIASNDVDSNVRIIVAPTPESTLYVDAYVFRYTSKLINDESVSFWSLNYPFLLVTAATVIYDRMMRNTEGVRAGLEVVMSELFEVQKDTVSSELPEDMTMEG